jgi:deazaflavin-dependent oxidoreductase (nitroreductase family)
MAIEKLPSGTRGTRTPPRVVAKLFMPVMTWVHRHSKDRFHGMDLLYLSTVGARSGQTRTHPVARFDADGGGWFVVASAGGAAGHPAWYHNLVAHPDRVVVEVAGRRHHVAIQQLAGAERDAAWRQVVARAQGFARYQTATDRQLPVLRLMPVD